ncbi:MAG: cbb3-type cytochrome c oxidase subunit 3 [Hydrogenophaga sp.]|nr:cbb3-type cytochrome c oxidase subunit 3 [Hydrogenophaga sp.]MBS3912008.1 cbb3-type cytochrome c oxidase subunit 3 [Hydrogenophaga sp.]MDO9149218.1 cbb3-type cytochrome c oxidase subunit 3 [Hydrogenophaga sp.]MDO9605801.1 cbb3-type cytochrome c oxidase subunit 3 [Hydrogenophaga sp.]MDP2166537.1 cbb3-type cytochrome c oxidase subunit 3 [Hydrogenophaga sp.]MDP3476056.1 cbb3-type cytochrome c oxidase subunit 3 [Hydrogenophaga sp.]
MDINDLRSAFTLVSFLIFMGILVWAWSKRNKANFDEAARLPFNED